MVMMCEESRRRKTVRMSRPQPCFRDTQTFPLDDEDNTWKNRLHRHVTTEDLNPLFMRPGVGVGSRRLMVHSHSRLRFLPEVRRL